MKKLLIKNANTINLLMTLLIIFFLVNMIISPSKFISQSLNGISAWAFNVLPSILPFMFFTRLLSSLGQVQRFTKPFGRFSRKLYNCPPISIYAFLMAILSGYPVGSKMIADLYEQRSITQDDAFRMSSFCSTSGPMFIIGAVGIGMFKNVLIGYLLFISHFIGAFLNGFLYRNMTVTNSKIKIFNRKNSTKESKNTQNEVALSGNDNLTTSNTSTKIDINDVVLSSTLSILSVGCIITIFFVIIECFAPIFNLLPDSIAFFLEGSIEITKGCIDLSTLTNLKLAFVLCSFVISFGGLSTVLQSITLLKKVDMPIRLFVLQKFTHAIISLLVALLLMFLL